MRYSKVQRSGGQSRTKINLYASVLTAFLLFAGIFAASGKVYAAGGLKREFPVSGWEPPIELESPDDLELPETTDDPDGTILLTPKSSSVNSLDDVFINGAGTNGYNALTDDQRIFYKRLDQAGKDFMNSSANLTYKPWDDYDAYLVAYVPYDTEGISLTREEAKQTWFAWGFDHPGYWWINNSVFDTEKSDGDTIHYVLLMTYGDYVTADARDKIKDQIISGVEEYAGLASYGTDDLDKIAMVHDRIVSTVDYAYDDSGKSESSKWAHSVQGVFDPSLSGVVCEGYADAFSLIMNYLGIPNYYIVGRTAAGYMHAWNAVSDDDGESYIYMDLTWDDRVEGDSAPGYLYTYFGMPETDFVEDHIAFTPSSSYWMYDLPDTFSDDLSGTYYYRGLHYYTGSTSYTDTEAMTFAAEAKTRAARVGNYVPYLSDTTGRLKAAGQALGLSDTEAESFYAETYKGTEYYEYLKFISAGELSLAEAEVTLKGGDSYGYTGSEIEPEVESVTLNGITLIPGENYTVSYSDNTSAGTSAKVNVTGAGNFSGTAAKAFSITDDKAGDQDDPEYKQSGTAFSVLRLRSAKQGRNNIRLTWKAAKGAAAYVIYGSKCGRANKMKKLCTVSSTSYNVKYLGKKLKKGTYYKFRIKAVDSSGRVISSSKTIHVATGGGRVKNPVRVTVKNARVTFKTGSTYKMSGKVWGRKVRTHRGLRYESSNTGIATVTSKGKVKAVGKGTCYVYAYAQNGIYKRTRITVV